LAAIVVLAIMLLVDTSRLATELRFFRPSSIASADGSAPVLQDSNRNPRIDADFRAAASHLPTTASCVIAVDSWHEDYFRASYIMMPRRIWPYAERSQRVPSTPDIAVAMARHHAMCALLAAGETPPRGLHQITNGTYSLYIKR
jgi:hypothetical protein